MIGIYKILNTIDNKSYYGSSKNIKKRWYDHKNQLRKNKHHNTILQRAWNKYGEDTFQFKIIEECDEKDLLLIEQKYLNINPGYNIGLKSSGGDNITNNPNKEKIIEKISSSVKKRYSNMTKEEIDKIHSRPGNSNYNWKGGVSLKYCKCGKQISPINETCCKCRNRNGEKNPFYGKTHTKENIEKFTKKYKNICLHHNEKKVIIENIEYKSLMDASKKLGISNTVIRWRCLSKNPKYKNYNVMGVKKISYSPEEIKQRHGEKKIGKKKHHNKILIIDEIEYRTLKDASQSLGIHPMTIRGRILSKKIEFKNYKYKNDGHNCI
jgi:group I intron endonuclease